MESLIYICYLTFFILSPAFVVPIYLFTRQLYKLRDIRVSIVATILIFLIINLYIWYVGFIAAPRVHYYHQKIQKMYKETITNIMKEFDE